MRSPLLFLIPALLAAQAPEPPKDLRAFFAQNCVRCHGEDGSARRFSDGKRLGGRDFTNPRDNRESDREMARTIRKGIFFGKVMPAFKDQLSEEEALRMVREVIRKAEKGKLIQPEG